MEFTRHTNFFGTFLGKNVRIPISRVAKFRTKRVDRYFGQKIYELFRVDGDPSWEGKEGHNPRIKFTIWRKTLKKYINVYSGTHLNIKYTTDTIAKLYEQFAKHLSFFRRSLPLLLILFHIFFLFLLVAFSTD